MAPVAVARTQIVSPFGVINQYMVRTFVPQGLQVSFKDPTRCVYNVTILKKTGSFCPGVARLGLDGVVVELGREAIRLDLFLVPSARVVLHSEPYEGRSHVRIDAAFPTLDVDIFFNEHSEAVRFKEAADRISLAMLASLHRQVSASTGCLPLFTTEPQRALEEREVDGKPWGPFICGTYVSVTYPVLGNRRAYFNWAEIRGPGPGGIAGAFRMEFYNAHSGYVTLCFTHQLRKTSLPADVSIVDRVATLKDDKGDARCYVTFRTPGEARSWVEAAFTGRVPCTDGRAPNALNGELCKVLKAAGSSPLLHQEDMLARLPPGYLGNPNPPAQPPAAPVDYPAPPTVVDDIPDQAFSFSVSVLLTSGEAVDIEARSDAGMSWLRSEAERRLQVDDCHVVKLVQADRVLDDDMDVYTAVACSSTPTQALVVASTTKLLAHLKRGEDGKEIKAAIKKLGTLGETAGNDPEAIDGLVWCLSAGPAYRALAAEALGQIVGEPSKCIPALIECIRETKPDCNWNVHSEALLALGRIASQYRESYGEEVRDWLVTYLEENRLCYNIGMRCAAVRALRLLGLTGERLWQELEAALLVQDPLLRISVVKALGTIGGRHHLEILLTVSEEDPESSVRNCASQAIQCLRNQFNLCGTTVP